MRIEWLHKTGDGRVVVFFNGWGMDGQAVRHLKTDMDVLMFYDYRDLQMREIPVLETYREQYAVAWSMGVWAVAQVLPQLKIVPSKKVALNGTERPVDDQYGIPVRIYELTEKGMNEKGRQKFVRRMLQGSMEEEKWEGILTERPLSEVCEELGEIRKKCTGTTNSLQWDKVYISEKDVIFPVANQQNWWRERCPDVRMIPGGHLPFCNFNSWEEIIEKS